MRCAVFPLAELPKVRVRQLAVQMQVHIGEYVSPRLEPTSCLTIFQLPTAHKRDSQGICFIGKRDFPSFISAYIPRKPGHFIGERGSVLASHSGHFQYTIGQAAALGGQPQRLYVAAKDAATNRVLIVPVRTLETFLSSRLFSKSFF
jgi:tRNA U34 2-thiouridine synthase MnmA/TrmU